MRTIVLLAIAKDGVIGGRRGRGRMDGGGGVWSEGESRVEEDGRVSEEDLAGSKGLSGYESPSFPCNLCHRKKRQRRSGSLGDGQMGLLRRRQRRRHCFSFFFSTREESIRV